jgi:hypothetical protein
MPEREKLKVGFWEIIGASWRGAFGAIRRDIPLFAVTFLVMLTIAAIMQPMLPTWHPSNHTGFRSHVARPMNLHFLLISNIQNVLISIAAAPCMITVHRFVLLNEHGKALHNYRRVAYFVVWLTSFHLLFSLPSLLIDRVPVLPFFVILILYYCIVRLVMSFPSVALDMPNPLPDSWTRTQGHWWKVAGVMTVGFLPLIILIIPFAGERNETIRIVFVAVLSCLSPALGAALASELYRNFGGLLQPAP